MVEWKEIRKTPREGSPVSLMAGEWVRKDEAEAKLLEKDHQLAALEENLKIANFKVVDKHYPLRSELQKAVCQEHEEYVAGLRADLTLAERELGECVEKALEVYTLGEKQLEEKEKEIAELKDFIGEFHNAWGDNLLEEMKNEKRKEPFMNDHEHLIKTQGKRIAELEYKVHLNVCGYNNRKTHCAECDRGDFPDFVKPADKSSAEKSVLLTDEAKEIIKKIKDNKYEADKPEEDKP